MKNKVTKYILTGCAVFVAAALVVATAIPYETTRLPNKATHSMAELVRNLDTDDHPLLPPGPTQASFITASYIIPTLPYVLASSTHTVRATVEKIEYAQDGRVVHNPKTKYIYTVADDPEALERVTHVLLVLRVQENITGSFGWRKYVRVYLRIGEWESFYSYFLQPGQQAVFALEEDSMKQRYDFLKKDPALKDRYSLNCGEYGVFAIQKNGTVLPLSNMMCNLEYKDRPLEKLMEDIKHYKKALGLR